MRESHSKEVAFRRGPDPCPVHRKARGEEPQRATQFHGLPPAICIGWFMPESGGFESRVSPLQRMFTSEFLR
jgi:hypothetical protein